MDVASIVSIIPGGDTAISYVAGKLREFDGAAQRLRVAQHTAAELAYLAKQRGDLGKQAALQQQIQRIGALLQKHGETRDQLAPVIDWLQSQGFGVALPVIVAIAAVAAATSIAFVIAQTGVEEKKLELIAQGLATPEQIADLNAQGGPSLINFDFGKLAPWLIAAAAAWWLMNQKGRGGALNW